MLVQPQGEAPSTSPSRITSSPSLQSHHTTSSTPTTSSSHHEAEEPVTMPHDSPLYSVHSHRSDEGRLKQTDLTDLVTKLSDRIKVLEKDLQQTKKTYSTALTKLVLRVKKLENQLKSGKARRRARIVLSEDEDAAEDSSKQGRKIAQIDEDPNISLVQDEGMTWFEEDEQVQEKQSGDTEVSTAARRIVYSKRSAEKRKDKGKAIMAKPEPKPEKKSKKQLEQERLGHKEAVRLQENI
ncbi:hypothetical protein Tco_1172012, partial [Tanacetum coccineum]